MKRRGLHNTPEAVPSFGHKEITARGQALDRPNFCGSNNDIVLAPHNGDPLYTMCRLSAAVRRNGNRPY